ncbi:MAG: 30S ribosomal protein S16 [Tepidiformaceae bacterium]
MIRIRLRRTGKKHRPSYRLVVADKPNKRDGAFLETLGSYDPHADPPLVTVDADKVKSWMSKGAQPSEAAEKILRRAGVITTPAPARKMVAPVAAKSASPAAAASVTPPTPKPAAAEAAPEMVPETAPEAPVAEAPVAETEAPVGAEESAPEAAPEEA